MELASLRSVQEFASLFVRRNRLAIVVAETLSRQKIAAAVAIKLLRLYFVTSDGASLNLGDHMDAFPTYNAAA